MVEKSFYLYCNWEKILNHITEEFYNLIMLVTKKHLERPQMVKKKRKKEEKNVHQSQRMNVESAHRCKLLTENLGQTSHRPHTENWSFSKPHLALYFFQPVRIYIMNMNNLGQNAGSSIHTHSSNIPDQRNLTPCMAQIITFYYT